MKRICCVVWLFAVLAFGYTQESEIRSVRARDLGIPFDGTPGSFNAITDVPGVSVGVATIIRGSGGLKPGTGPVRTGVTVILPARDFAGMQVLPAGMFSLNGMGELTGAHFLRDYHMLYGPIGLTTTTGVGVVRDAIGEWLNRKFSSGDVVDFSFGLPVVGETWDGLLNDINGLHIRKAHVFDALRAARSGQVPEGNAGGGTGMVLYGFKGGNGTSSRVIEVHGETCVVGVFVQANFGRREQLVIRGVPVGREIVDLQPRIQNHPRRDGSIIAVVATNVPLLPWQLDLVARRVSLGVARTGSYGMTGSGDIFLAFSTVNNGEWSHSLLEAETVLNPVFRATVEATEEAVINALVAAETMTGINGNTVYALPHDRLKAVMKKYQP